MYGFCLHELFCCPSKNDTFSNGVGKKKVRKYITTQNDLDMNDWINAYSTYSKFGFVLKIMPTQQSGARMRPRIQK